MNLIFLSNYFNHHQKSLCDAFYKMLGDEFRFIETDKIGEERIKLGYKTYTDIPYTVDANNPQNESLCKELIDNADVVVFGDAPYEMIENRLKAGKLTFRSSERIFKEPPQKWKMPIRALKNYFRYGRYKNFHLLCASAYASADYARIASFRKRAYKWGYFPEVKKYGNVDELLNNKKQNSVLWCGRLIDWKHPELFLEAARRLKADGYKFTLDVIGTGDKQDEIVEHIQKNELADVVAFHGSMSPSEVREYMEKSRIFLFTSDRNEGWGAVLNESMNSACAVVASHAIGSVPFLLDDKQNGMIYKDGVVDDFYAKIKYLLDNPSVCNDLGRRAYYAMQEEWNGENAAKKLVAFSEMLLNDNKAKTPYKIGRAHV